MISFPFRFEEKNFVDIFFLKLAELTNYSMQHSFEFP